MKSKIYLSLIAMIISAVGCHKEENNISQATSSGFSDTVVQKGSDEDTTYFSIRTSHQLNGTLNIDVSGWGIQETGLHIDASPAAKVAISKYSPAHQRQLDARGNQFLLCAFFVTPFSHQVRTFSNRDGECPMRNFLACCIAAAVLAVAPVGSRPAEAMPISTPQAIGAGQVQSNLEQAAYVCRRVWRCGSWGCGWRRTCYWKPRPYRRCVWTQWGRRCW